jgi:NAD+ diphosphatase
MSRLAYRFCPLCRNELVPRPRGGRTRNTCPDETCGFVHWDNPVPVVAAIVERAGRVVLVRSHGFPANWFALVTGFLEPDEAPAEAVLREVEEELGIEGRLGEFIGVYPFARLNQIIFAYHVHGGDGPIRLCEEELAEHREVPLEKLRPWPQGTGPAVRDWLAQRGYHPPTVELGAEAPDDGHDR